MAGPITRRRIIRKRIRRRIRGTAYNRTQRLAAFSAAAYRMTLRELQSARTTTVSDHYEARTVTETVPGQPSSSTNDGARSGGTEDRSATAGSDSSPDVSPEFRSEMAALLAFYAARIGAVRRSLHRTTADMIILAILGEQTVALRALTDRWHAASERQRTERQERLAGTAQRNDELRLQ